MPIKGEMGDVSSEWRGTFFTAGCSGAVLTDASWAWRFALASRMARVVLMMMVWCMAVPFLAVRPYQHAPGCLSRSSRTANGPEPP